MPRKPTEHEPTVLRIEGLSELGKRVDTPQPKIEPCDFGGPPVVIPPTPDAPRRKVAPDHRKLAQEAEARDKAEKLSMLVRLGLSDEPDPIPRPKVEVVPKGFRKIGEIDGKAILFPNAPWRRV